MDEFKIDVAAGDIPALVWLEPGYFNTPNQGNKILIPTYSFLKCFLVYYQPLLTSILTTMSRLGSN